MLPGVTVEVASDVLIEKTRSVATDSQGEYKIVDLRPGAYIVRYCRATCSTPCRAQRRFRASAS